ncbi:hypothetical protein CP061683_0914B, partial [Chlamydia psittaci 06-1683]
FILERKLVLDSPATNEAGYRACRDINTVNKNLLTFESIIKIKYVY